MRKPSRALTLIKTNGLWFKDECYVFPKKTPAGRQVHMTHNKSGGEQSSTMSNTSILMRRLSLEATLPVKSELDELREILPSTTLIFVSAPPGHPPLRLVEASTQIRRAGFEPVPHIAARNYPSREALSNFIERVCGESGARRALVIAGDVDSPAGPFSSANSIIVTGLLQRHGIREIGISGYPDEHPKLSDGIVERALRDKLSSAKAGDVGVQIVSQFCFNANRIIAWLRTLRESGVAAPVRIGVAGPTSARGLARYALRCGVRNSFNAALAGKATQLLAQVSPEEIVCCLGEVPDLQSLGEVSMHVYSFGGLIRTARWAASHQTRFGL